MSDRCACARALNSDISGPLMRIAAEAEHLNRIIKIIFNISVPMRRRWRERGRPRCEQREQIAIQTAAERRDARTRAHSRSRKVEMIRKRNETENKKSSARKWHLIGQVTMAFAHSSRFSFNLSSFLFSCLFVAPH